MGRMERLSRQEPRTATGFLAQVRALAPPLQGPCDPNPFLEINRLPSGNR